MAKLLTSTKKEVEERSLTISTAGRSGRLAIAARILGV